MQSSSFQPWKQALCPRSPRLTLTIRLSNYSGLKIIPTSNLKYYPLIVTSYGTCVVVRERPSVYVATLSLVAHGEVLLMSELCLTQFPIENHVTVDLDIPVEDMNKR
jgi:hypothetical protein